MVIRRHCFKMKYLSNSKKSTPNAELLRQGLEILESVGIPLENKSDRALEKMAMAFLAVAGVKVDLKTAKGLDDKRFLKTREIIQFINTNFEEKISSGSYDDIRRKDLKLLVLAGLVLNSAEKPNAATNDPTRGYALEPEFTKLIKSYRTDQWEHRLASFLEKRTAIKDLLARNRNIKKVPARLPDNLIIELTAGQHNLLQKQIIEEFLPRFGQGCQLLYVGDTADKLLFLEKKALENLNFFELSHDELPDIIAFQPKKNWLFLIEAVHSSGSISDERMLELSRLTQNCTAEIIYVTAFLTKSEFRKWACEIAWETEVWIAENPDHLIHFDGNKFLGPYKK